MRSVRLLTGCVCLALAWNQVRHADAQPLMSGQVVSNASTMYVTQAPAGPQVPTTPQAPGRPAPQDLAAAPQAAPSFGEAAPAGTEASGGAYAPQMMGDSIIYFTNGIGLLTQQQIVQLFQGNLILNQFLGHPVIVNSFPTTSQLLTVLAGPAGSGLKIGDDGCALCQDRASFNVDYYTAVNHKIRGQDPINFGNQRIAREIFLYERTCADGDASLEVRVPLFQVHTGEAVATGPSSAVGGTASTLGTELGDITLIPKVMLINDRTTRTALGVGLALTLPTGPDQVIHDFFFNANAGTFTLARSNIVNPFIFQPYVGYIYYLNEDLYLHGFMAVAVPSQEIVPTLWFNDLAVGFYAYRTGDLSIVPTAELHLTTPLSHRGADSFPVGAPDMLITTLGAHLMWREAALTLGVELPLMGPQPFATGLVAQFNYHF